MTDVELIRKVLYDVLSPDFEVDSKGYRHAAEAVAGALAGRLLPEPGETRTEYEVRWHDDDDDGLRLEHAGLSSLAIAHNLGPKKVGQYGITRYTVWRREHRIFSEGSWTGGWVAVDPEEG